MLDMNLKLLHQIILSNLLINIHEQCFYCSSQAHADNRVYE